MVIQRLMVELPRSMAGNRWTQGFLGAISLKTVPVMEDKLHSSNEHLEIRNFLGLPSVNFDVFPFTILIGPNASGKSTIAKILYFTKSIYTHLIDLYSAQIITRKVPTEDETGQYLQRQFLKLFPNLTSNKSSFVIKYRLSENITTIKGGNNSIEVNLPNGVLESLNSIFSRHIETKWEDYESHGTIKHTRPPYVLPRRHARNEAIVNFYEAGIPYKQLFIPALRSIFAIVKSNIFTLLDANTNLDQLIIDFGSTLEQAKAYSSYIDREEKEKVSEFRVNSQDLAKKIIKGNYTQKGDVTFIRHTNGSLVALQNCSSGQQESLPLALTLCCDVLYDPFTSIYIEEPEAHLYPASQKDVAELIALAFNTNKPQIFITTHSPYILTSINNLIEAGRLYQKKPTLKKRGKLKSLVAPELALTPSQVGVFLLTEKSFESIIDDETGLIDTHIIDKVSAEIAIAFDKMFDMDS